MSTTEVLLLQTGISEKHYQLMVHAIQNMAMMILDKSGVILSWNPGAETIHSYQADEVIGQHFACLYTPTDQQNKVPLQALEKALREGRYEEEGWHVRKDETHFWANNIITPLYDGQVHIGFSKITRDFTRRRESEEKLKEAVKELADIKYALDESAIVAITDKHGTITYVNDTFCKISKYSREELLGQNHRIINSGYHPLEFFKTMWWEISHGNVWRGEVKNKTKDGSYYWVDTTIVPFVDQEGKPYQYIAIRHEITDRKRVEAEIRQLNEEMEQRIHTRTAELQEANERLSETLGQLQESEQLRSTFISALTHDLRTPLVAQERAVELFLSNQSKIPPKLGELAEKLYKSNQGLLEMVNLLLETYQYEAGKITLLWEPVHLYQLVETCFSDVAALAESKQIKLTNLIPPDFPEIHGDTHQLKRVFMNLIGNALQNIPNGAYIQIQGYIDQGMVNLTVEDNGPGIPQEIRPHLFKRYYIGDQRNQKIGTGLGLYICKMIMEQHHGSITVESHTGQGTIFYLTLPIDALGD